MSSEKKGFNVLTKVYTLQQQAQKVKKKKLMIILVFFFLFFLLSLDAKIVNVKKKS